MKSKLSGLLDGELEEREESAVFDALKCDDVLRTRWQEYLLIRDALKGRVPLKTDITSRVMASLDDEPVVLAPPAKPRKPVESWQHAALALAATVAGVAVVGWMALGTLGGQSPNAVATLASNQPAVIQPVRQASREMQEYLVAHQAQSSLLQFRGGAEHIRTVAAMRTAASK